MNTNASINKPYLIFADGQETGHTFYADSPFGAIRAAAMMIGAGSATGLDAIEAPRAFKDIPMRERYAKAMSAIMRMSENTNGIDDVLEASARVATQLDLTTHYTRKLNKFATDWSAQA